jgi:hypothetical protein
MNSPPSDTDALAAHVDYLYSFFGPLGEGPNQTGTTHVNAFATAGGDPL